MRLKLYNESVDSVSLVLANKDYIQYPLGKKKQTFLSYFILSWNTPAKMSIVETKSPAFFLKYYLPPHTKFFFLSKSKLKWLEQLTILAICNQERNQLRSGQSENIACPVS